MAINYIFNFGGAATCSDTMKVDQGKQSPKGCNQDYSNQSRVGEFVIFSVTRCWGVIAVAIAADL